MNPVWIVFVSVFGYFFGNISFARIISRFFLKSDITKSGSGNPGTMNMYRTFGAKIGLLVLLLDVLKGVIPSLIGRLILGTNGIFIGGAGAVLGHIYPVIFKFKGGKGVATALGVFWAASPIVMSITFVCTVAFLIFFELGGMASILTIAAVTCYEATKFEGNYVVLGCLLGIFALVWFAHRKNILKTLTGDERKTSIRKLFAKKSK